MDPLKKFNEQLDHFVCFLENIFTSHPEIQANLSLIRMFKKSNPRGACELFYLEFLPYEVQINNMNEDFFVQLSKQQYQSYEKDLQNVIEIIYTYINDDIMYEKSVENPSETNKQRIWKYIKVLLFLSKKCNE
jgi:hypothetical protein